MPDPQDPRAPAGLAGELVADMGLNCGFDLMGGRVAQDQEGIALCQARLLRAVGALQAHMGSNGARGKPDGHQP
ncbi:MAG TPA: hypothetical protein VFH27_11855 [Longimicrobiaceae bacterium]|nr:hypothetical protein [Longimicrobiaceae bacterium]